MQQPAKPKIAEPPAVINPAIENHINAYGFFVNHHGYGISSAQGVQNCQNMRAILADGSQVKAKLQRIHAQADLALLKLDVESNSAARLDANNALNNGDTIYAFARLLPVQTQYLDPLVSAKINNLVKRNKETTTFQFSTNQTLKQKGAPIFDVFGNVIGIITEPNSKVAIFATRASQILTFLETNQITYYKNQGSQTPLAYEELGNQAKDITFQLECVNEVSAD